MRHWLVLLLIAPAALLHGQAPDQKPPGFEVASVKPNRSHTPPTAGFPLGPGDVHPPEPAQRCRTESVEAAGSPVVHEGHQPDVVGDCSRYRQQVRVPAASYEKPPPANRLQLDVKLLERIPATRRRL